MSNAFDRPDEETDSLLDRLRGTGVGSEDPNIVGDAGPTDVPPGRDTPSDDLVVADKDEDTRMEPKP